MFKPKDPSAGPGFTNGLSFRLESVGLNNMPGPQINNRAELTAIFGALCFREWYGERWENLVIATDSGYAVDGITSYIDGWAKGGWLTSKGKPVLNRDLGEAILVRLRYLRAHGTKVSFWHIAREWNEEAGAAAISAVQKEIPKGFVHHRGIVC